MSEIRIETSLTGKDHKLGGYVVTMQKKMVGNPHQMWKFNEDATIATKVSRQNLHEAQYFLDGYSYC